MMIYFPRKSGKSLISHILKGETISMTIEQMRGKLLEWHPSWNLDRFTNEQISVIYNKERNKLVEMIVARYQ